MPDQGLSDFLSFSHSYSHSLFLILILPVSRYSLVFFLNFFFSFWTHYAPQLSSIRHGHPEFQMLWRIEWRAESCADNPCPRGEQQQCTNTSARNYKANNRGTGYQRWRMAVYSLFAPRTGANPPGTVMDHSISHPPGSPGGQCQVPLQRVGMPHSFKSKTNK